MNRQEYSKQLVKIREHLVVYTIEKGSTLDKGCIRLMYAIMTQAMYDIMYGKSEDYTSAKDFFSSTRFNELCELLYIKPIVIRSIAFGVDKYNISELSEDKDDESYF